MFSLRAEHLFKSTVSRPESRFSDFTTEAGVPFNTQPPVSEAGERRAAHIVRGSGGMYHRLVTFHQDAQASF